MRQIIETLTNEELAELRRLSNRNDAADCAPPDLTFDKALEIKNDLLNFMVGIYEKYGLDNTENWHADPVTGHILYGEE